jgi:hypothetical protein
MLRHIAGAGRSIRNGQPFGCHAQTKPLSRLPSALTSLVDEYKKAPVPRLPCVRKLIIRRAIGFHDDPNEQLHGPLVARSERAHRFPIVIISKSVDCDFEQLLKLVIQDVGKEAVSLRTFDLIYAVVFR